MKDLKVIFMGTPDFAVPALEFLIKNTNVLLVVTQPDKQVGRDKKLVFSPVKSKAIEHNIDVFQPEKIRNDFEIISEINPDIIITCAYGQIIPKEILDVPKLGCINIHASLLPKYRGAAPIQHAILNGDEITGITLMYMDEKMDTGDIIAQSTCEILPSDNIETLHEKLSILGVNLLKEEMPKIINKTNKREKQNENDATYAKMIKREDELLNFNKDGKKIINKIRAFNPWPVSYFVLNNLEIKVYSARFEEKSVKKPGEVIVTKKDFGITCNNGIIYLEIVKPFGKKQMNISAFINGLKDKGNLEINL